MTLTLVEHIGPKLMFSRGRVAVDIDGVLADLNTEWLARYNKDYDDDLRYDEIKSWGLHGYVKPECGKKIYKYLEADDLYDNVPMVDGAKEGVAELRKMGHEVVFVSSGFFMAKVKWLRVMGFNAHKGESWYAMSDVVLAHDKSIIKATAIIDDKPENLSGFAWKFLFNQPWNEDFVVAGSTHRVFNWEDVIDRFEHYFIGEAVYENS